MTQKCAKCEEWIEELKIMQRAFERAADDLKQARAALEQAERDVAFARKVVGVE